MTKFIKKSDIIDLILANKTPQFNSGIKESYAPINIALIKYWGKKDQELNIPMTPSLSLAINDKGTWSKISESSQDQDEIILNNNLLNAQDPIAVRLVEFLDLFRPKKENKKFFFKVNTRNNIPIATGLASSASAFASIVKALNTFFGWDLKNTELSILARLGSGSASRSFGDGFMEWGCGQRSDGMDSYAIKIANKWPDLQITPIILASKKKKVSSRVAMQHIVETSPFYKLWPEVVKNDLSNIKQAIKDKDFTAFGRISEHNACAMHAMTLSSRDPLFYYAPETITIINKIWDLRQGGVEIYFTQDAGPNIILLYLKKDLDIISKIFFSEGEVW